MFFLYNDNGDNMQRYFASNKDNQTVILTSDDLHHILRVMRMKSNDEIEVVFNHELFLCVLNINESDIEIRVLKQIKQVVENNIEITLIIPILKEAKMDLILQKSTELGVNKIIPVVMSRSIVKIDGKEDKKLERWRRICKEASEQSMRLDIPMITEIKQISELTNYEGIKIVCSTVEKVNNIRLFLQKTNKYDKIMIVIGPEGGLTTTEENQFKELGFTPVSLGKRIMRVETVPLFILSVLNYENME